MDRFSLASLIVQWTDDLYAESRAHRRQVERIGGEGAGK
jgi:hypothetical protein